MFCQHKLRYKSKVLLSSRFSHSTFIQKVVSRSTMAKLLQRILWSNTMTCFRTLLSIITYTQDILQDVLVIISSISSDEVYNVLFNMKIAERSFGFAMACMFGCSVLVVGWETMLQGRKLILIKKCPWIHALLVLACLLNLGPVFLTVLKLLLHFDCIKLLYKDKRLSSQF